MAKSKTLFGEKLLPFAEGFARGMGVPTSELPSNKGLLQEEQRLINEKRRRDLRSSQIADQLAQTQAPLEGELMDFIQAGRAPSPAMDAVNEAGQIVGQMNLGPRGNRNKQKADRIGKHREETPLRQKDDIQLAAEQGRLYREAATDEIQQPTAQDMFDQQIVLDPHGNEMIPDGKGAFVPNPAQQKQLDRDAEVANQRMQILNQAQQDQAARRVERTTVARDRQKDEDERNAEWEQEYQKYRADKYKDGKMADAVAAASKRYRDREKQRAPGMLPTRLTPAMREAILDIEDRKEFETVFGPRSQIRTPQQRVMHRIDTDPEGVREELDDISENLRWQIMSRDYASEAERAADLSRIPMMAMEQLENSTKEGMKKTYRQYMLQKQGALQPPEAINRPGFIPQPSDVEPGVPSTLPPGEMPPEPASPSDMVPDQPGGVSAFMDDNVISAPMDDQVARQPKETPSVHPSAKKLEKALVSHGYREGTKAEWFATPYALGIAQQAGKEDPYGYVLDSVAAALRQGTPNWALMNKSDQDYHLLKETPVLYGNWEQIMEQVKTAGLPPGSGFFDDAMNYYVVPQFEIEDKKGPKVDRWSPDPNRYEFQSVL